MWFYIGKDFDELNKQIQTSCELIDIQLSRQLLRFPERLVRLIKANNSQLAELIEQCDFISEIRLAKETARFWLTENNSDQVEWLQNLIQRTTFIFGNDIGVCILDTGINNGHLLLAPVLQNNDRHSIYTPIRF